MTRTGEAGDADIARALARLSEPAFAAAWNNDED
jgi:hypothetical protein